ASLPVTPHDVGWVAKPTYLVPSRPRSTAQRIHPHDFIEDAFAAVLVFQDLPGGDFTVAA
ncbi:hypothetical protein, partial [Thiothrix sp. UBA2332]|uniref:hypothetical protein n=1 Tax=Thiothrix sp. UBA2332 TaxID=1947696 RepID=UPI0025D14453